MLRMCRLRVSNAFLVVLALSVAGFSAVSQHLSTDRPSRVTIIRPEFGGEPARLPTIVPHRPLKRPKVGLVLSGGGSRGIAAIGVLRAFEKADIPVDVIVGTSMGSIIGGLYAVGYSTAQLEQVVDTTKWDELLSFSDEARRKDLFYDQKLAEDRSLLVVRFKGLEPILPRAYSTGQTLLNYLNILTLQGIYHPNPRFDDLRIPFRAVATDLISGKRVVIDRGDLAEAMRASMTVPLLFSPVTKDSMLLVDGGLSSNISADVARELGADIVVVVDATSPLRPPDKLNALWELADQIMGVVMKGKMETELQQADIVIRPELGENLSTDFSRLDWLIAQGEHAAHEQLSGVKELLQQRSHALLGKADSDVVYVKPHVISNSRMIGSEESVMIQEFARSQKISEQGARSFVNDLYDRGDFETVELTVTEFTDSTELNLIAMPNPIIMSVDILGANLVPLDTLDAAVKPLVGHRMNVHAVRKMLEELLGIYRDRGLSLARIRDVRFDSVIGKATIEIDEGVVYRRDILGTTKTKDYVIWRELPWDEGEVFQVSKIAQGIANLYGTNLFEFVSIGVQYEGAKNERNIVTINVRERSTDLIRLGMRIDNERNFQPTLDVRDENLLGIGMEIGARIYGGQRTRGYIGEFKANRIFDSYFTFHLRANYEYRDVNVYADEPSTNPERWSRVKVGEYRELRSGWSMAFGTQLERLGVVSIEGRLETHRVWSTSGRPFDTESFRFASVKFGTKVDNLDRFPFPRDGVSMNFFYESALVRVRDNVGFTKMFFQYEGYQSYFGRHTLRPKVVFGFADQTLPITEQFSIGGQNSFFGLQEYNARGRQLFVASLEYRYHLPLRLFFDTYLKARYDFGTLWASADAIKLRDLRHGIGLSLALDTPIGPAEFSVGRSFYFRNEILEQPISLGPFVFYFSIGYPL